MLHRWNAVNAIYQIYPRSFFDGDGDGTGDLTGIIKKLGYLKGDKGSLHVDAIWLSPFYKSPMADFGYDIADYYAIDPLFGTMEDFKLMVAEAHKRHIKVMIDFVPNHTSDEHDWFLESKSSKDNPRRDWYIWADPLPDGSPPNNWLSVFGGSAWEYDEKTGQYYLHSFLAKQPDLNWENPEVRRAMKNVLRYWLEHGVDGIRADAVWVMAKDAQLRDNPSNPNYEEGRDDPYHKYLHHFDMYGDKLFVYLKEMADVVAEYPDHIILFEDYSTEPSTWLNIHSNFYEVNPSVAAPFNFEGILAPYDARAYRDFVYRFENELGNSLRPFYCFGNHDNSRLRSRVGDQESRAVAVVQLTLPGIPVIYYGDELGMKDGTILPHQVRDPFELQVPGFGLGRDPARTPMQWDTTAHAGFSDVEPWLPVGAQASTINVESEQNQDDSFFSLYSKMLKLRYRAVYRHGRYSEWSGSNDHLYGFYREYRHEKMLTIANMSTKPRTVTLKEKGDIIVSTHRLTESRIKGKLHLEPHQAVVVQLFMIR